MKTIKIDALGIIAIIVWILISAVIIQSVNAQSMPDSSAAKVYKTLIVQDSLLFNAAFNTCNMKDIEASLDAGFEFYPDNGASVYQAHQTRKEFLDGILKNFCGPKNADYRKMKREID